MENLEVNPGFWHGRRVFLTGHTGFKGSWLSLWLQQLNAVVTGYALAPSTQPSLFEAAKVADGMTSIIGDITDLPSLRKAMQQARPEVVIHMAAQPLVRYSYDNPIETYTTNVIGTVNLLESVRATPGVAAVVNITTDKCYENREWVWGYRETDPLGGYDPYSSSKACSELVTASYRSSFFNPLHHDKHGIAVATARAGNVIGGGDWAKDRLIPDIIEAFGKEVPALIRNPHAIRPWQHVLEPLRGYLTLAQKLVEDGSLFSEAWNFGPNDEDARPVGWIADQLATRWGKHARWDTAGGEHPHEAHYLKLDISKSRSRLGWTPALSLAEALDLVLVWSQQKNSGADIRSLTEAQIRRYQEQTKAK